MKTRLNKYLSEIGCCSRRNADKLIKEEKVTVNGKIAELELKSMQMIKLLRAV